LISKNKQTTNTKKFKQFGGRSKHVPHNIDGQSKKKKMEEDQDKPHRALMVEAKENKYGGKSRHIS
jgi:hypothetical protein